MTICMCDGIIRSADNRSSGLISMAFIHSSLATLKRPDRTHLAAVPIDIIYRNPCVAAAVDANVADSGKRQMSSSNQTAFRCQRRELTLSLRGRCGRIHVIDNRDPRLGELHRGNMHDVAHQLQLLALAFDQTEAVSGRMTRCGYRGYTRQQLRSPQERFDLARAQIG